MTNSSTFKFSIVLIGKNEGHNLDRTLPALADLSDDIILVDTNSTDHTPQLCAKYGVRLLQKEWLGYAQTKNWGNAQARYNWILSIDADEVISEELARALRELQPNPGTVYLLDRISSVGDQWVHHCGWYPDWKPRLFERQKVHWEGDYVHEQLVIPEGFQQVNVPGKLWHHSYRDLADLRERSLKYARLSAKKLFDQGRSIPRYKDWLSPYFRFVRTLLLKSAWRDGKLGWQIATNNVRMVKEKYRHFRYLQKEKRG